MKYELEEVGYIDIVILYLVYIYLFDNTINEVALCYNSNCCVGYQFGMLSY